MATAPNPQAGFSILPAETPECKAKSTVRVKTDGDLPRGVQLTLEFDGSTESTDSRMGHLQNKGHTGCSWHPTGTGTALTSFSPQTLHCFIA